MAFVDQVVQVHAVGFRGRLGIPLEGGMGEALVEVSRQDGIAIHGDAEFAEWLAFYGAEVAQQGGSVQVFDAIHPQAVDEGLRTLLDFQKDGELARLAAIVVLRAAS